MGQEGGENNFQLKPEKEIPRLENSPTPNKIEVGCTPSGKTPPSVLVSIPVYYKEWQNGNFLRHIEGHLHQRMSEGDSLEVNYILNYRGDRSNDTPEYKTTQQMRDFLRILTRLQTLQKKSFYVSGEGKNQIQDEISASLKNEQDEERRRTLELAVQKSNTIQFSYIDISSLTAYELVQLGYPRGNELQGTMRTFGLDYARKRLKKSPNSVFQLSDCDTLPSSNSAYEQLVTYYRNNPDVPFQFTGLAYQMPGRDVFTFSKAFYQAVFRTRQYNQLLTHGSPQISVRSSFLNEEGLESIRSINRRGKMSTGVEANEEDYATSKRLRALKEDDIDAGSFPSFIFLTQVRPDGAVDGTDSGKLYGKPDISTYFYWRDKLLKRINTSGTIAKQDLESALQKYEKETEKLRRFVRWGAKEFVKELGSGNIRIDSGELTYEPDNLKSGALRLYLAQNQELFNGLTQNDISYLQYLLELAPRPVVKELTDKQVAMREYFGAPETIDRIKSHLYEKRDAGYRGSRMYAIFAEALALGEIYSKHFAQHDAWNGIPGFDIGFRKNYPSTTPMQITREVNESNPMLPYKQRTSWLDILD